MNPADLVSTLLGLSPHVLAALGAVGVLALALQALLLAIAKLVPAASPAARVLAVLSTDLGIVASWSASAARWLLARVTKPSGPAAFVFVLFGYTAALGAACGLSYACNPAQRAALGVPALSQVDAVGVALSHAVGWCEAHGADEEAVTLARIAIAKHDTGAAISVVRKLLIASAAAGEPIPPEVVALVELAQGAMYSQAIQDGMRAVSRASDAGAE